MALVGNKTASPQITNKNWEQYAAASRVQMKKSGKEVAIGSYARREAQRYDARKPGDAVIELSGCMYEVPSSLRG